LRFRPAAGAYAAYRGGEQVEAEQGQDLPYEKKRVAEDAMRAERLVDPCCRGDGGNEQQHAGGREGDDTAA